MRVAMQEEHCRPVPAVPHVNYFLADISVLSHEILEQHTIIHPGEQVRERPGAGRCPGPPRSCCHRCSQRAGGIP